jgi:SAM-dependent methyltransferase
MVGLALANSFHPQIWEARVRGKSALDVFYDDSSFQASLTRAPRMWLHRKCWSAACIRMLSGLQNRSRVANFRPTVSRVVAATLSESKSRILDFCAGYGGRYLGIATLDRFYFGIDAALRQIAGLSQMSQCLSPLVPSQAQFHCGGAEDVLQDLESRSFDLVFTSPPYFRLEKYEDNERQCWRKYSSYHDWRECFLSRVLKESLRVLRPGGVLAINLANYGPYSIADDFEALCRQQFKRRVHVWKIFMSTNPRFKKASGVHTKSEPLFIIRN